MREYFDITEENAGNLLNPNVRDIKKSATLEINEKSIQLQKQGRKIYRFGFGQSPYPVPEDVVKKLQQSAYQKDYLAVKGLKELRYEIAQWLNRSEKLSFTEDDILVGPGSKQLLFLIGLNLDCELIVGSPCWVSYIPQIKFLGKKVKVVETKYENRWRLTPQELQQACKSQEESPNKKNKFLILTYPDNPTGLTYKPQQLEALAKVARKYHVIIVSDQIYGKMDYEAKHQSIARYYPEGTVISSGLSKWAGAGGWRLGVFAFPKQLRWVLNSMGNIASETFTSVSCPIQYAACVAFRQGQKIDKYLEGSRAILKFLSDWVYEKTTSEGGLLTHKPQGGFYLFLDFEKYRQKLQKKDVKTSKEMANLLLEEVGVAILPGVSFARKQSELTVRLSFINYDGEAALKAYNEGEEVNMGFLKKYCGDTVEGIEVLVKWLKSL